MTVTSFDARTTPTRRAPSLLVVGAVLLAALVIGAGESQAFGQATVNGLVVGSYFAMGAVGLTFVYGILKLVNFAHGDLLTLGAYAALVFNVAVGMPLVPSIAVAAAVVAAASVAVELVIWRPMRERRAGTLQLILMTIGLAFVIRNSILLVAGGDVQTLGVDVSKSISLFGGLRIGTTQLAAAAVAYAVLVAVGVMLRTTALGTQMRALSDNTALAGTTGIDTGRVIMVTWIFAGGLAGLAGSLYAASSGGFDPNFGFVLLLSLFAAVILGGIGNAYGALAGGIALGLVEEWSTLVVADRWKIAVGFLVLIAMLVARPQGILGTAAAP